MIDSIRVRIDCRLLKDKVGFRSGRETTEQGFIPRNILEQVNERQASLYIQFVDFKNAFDSVPRSSLWIVMKHYGIPQKIINIVKALYDGVLLLMKIATYEGFKITTGIKQGCTMSG